MNTKDKIRHEALKLFSSQGYDAVSVRDIARAVGVKESSLYNHFKNKQDIFDDILREYAQRTEAFFNQMNVTGEDKQFTVDTRTIEMYQTMSNEAFEAMCAPIFDFYFMDEINVMLRRMLTLEQFRSPELAKLYREISFDTSLDFQAQLFGALMASGHFVSCDPYVLALAFFAPIFLIFTKFDNDEQQLDEARSLFLRHVRHFNATYTKKAEV